MKSGRFVIREVIRAFLTAGRGVLIPLLSECEFEMRKARELFLELRGSVADEREC